MPQFGERDVSIRPYLNRKFGLFACRSLTNVTFPSSLTEIGNNAFNMCGFKTLTLPSGLTKIGKEAFADCIRLKSLTLSPSLTSIGVEAFGGLGNLRTLTIPSGLTSIDSLKKYDDEFEESYLGFLSHLQWSLYMLVGKFQFLLAIF